MIVDRVGERLLLVPVRSGGGMLALRYFRTAAGVRTVVGFTSRELLAGVLGASQEFVKLSEQALRGMVGGLDTVGILVDPSGTAEAGAGARRKTSARRSGRGLGRGGTSAPARCVDRSSAA
ncbi:SAV_915 family protein [Sinosporangium siamense]|uniref:SAV_915 family protein n=1 Tax=Sinosporangium siamense TaxID=1367973 RepID=UPI00194DD479|nr:SAV_915 family protein [Sinosporangium siamense]